MTYCRRCNGVIFQFDDAPEWSPDGWALDLSSDPVRDFICPARSRAGNYYLPHEPAPQDDKED